MGKIINLIGKKFNRLTVIERVQNANDNSTQWLCQCDCGNQIVVRGKLLRLGFTKSCGCLRKETTKRTNKEYKVIHKGTGTRLYRIWKGMKNRCLNSSIKDYIHYGGRGIKVCDEWLNNFIIFKDWAMRNGYTDELTIDRIDVNGNYEPSNCRWITDKEQKRNKRNNHLLTINNETHCIAEWMEKLNVSRQYLLKIERGK